MYFHVIKYKSLDLIPDKIIGWWITLIYSEHTYFSFFGK